MKINIIILILIIIVILYFLYLNTETFKQKELTNSNSNIENLPGSYCDITGLYVLDKKKNIEKFIEHETNAPTITNTLAPVSSPIENIIDEILENNSLFALSVTIPIKGIYPENMINPPETKYVKVYLSVANKSKNYSKCTNLSGMLSLRPKLTKGGIFYLSKESRNILKKKYPYKYLDFYDVIYNSTLKKNYIQSMFYSLHLYNTRNYITYCAEKCQNKRGFCAQETLFTKRSTEYPGVDANGNKKTDDYNLKNLLKFVIEGDTATSTKVTPYFISMDPDEKIHFLTNEYNTKYDKNGYKRVIQVPIYDKNQRPFYKEPVYINTNTPSTTKYFKPASKLHTDEPSITNTPSITNAPSNTILAFEKIIIKNLEPILTDFNTDAYVRQQKMGIQETQVTKNDAYMHYALKFDIEIFTKQQVNRLPTN
jgi:hypothetical protein